MYFSRRKSQDLSRNLAVYESYSNFSVIATSCVMYIKLTQMLGQIAFIPKSTIILGLETANDSP